MRQTLTGLLEGNTITLDKTAPSLDGQRVRVVVEPIDESEVELSVEENARLWAEWREREEREGDGPIQDVDLEWA